MKYYENHFEEYLSESIRFNLHPKLEKLFANFPATIGDLKNLIFYGPGGTGKYTQMLKSIRKYSPTNLKYEKKWSLTFNKQQYYFKISDIHYEIDMSLLGCNSKLLWHEIYQQLIDIVSAKTEKSGIIVCKNFSEIHNELLDNFYSYMQQNNSTSTDLKFILITEELSFIPDNILNCCEIIHVSRPTKLAYSKCVKNKTVMPTKLSSLENITNIKMIHLYNENLMIPYKIICDKIIHLMVHVDELQFLKFRDILYDMFIYNLDVTDCVWYILSVLFEQNKLERNHLSLVLKKTYCFFQYFNNNYRPIYHLEKYLFALMSIVHKFDEK